MTTSATNINENSIPPQLDGKVLCDKRYVIPAAGVEAIPLATLASIDLNGNGVNGGIFEMTAENSIGSVLVVVAYQSVLTALKSEQARQAGEITRQQQMRLVASTAMESGRSSAFTLVICSAIITLLPWTTPVFAVLGIVGGVGMASRITHEFWGSLDAKQQAELRNAAAAAKVNLDRILPPQMEVDKPVAVPAVA